MTTIRHLKRHSIRLPDYNYSAPGAYFLTICTNPRRPLFGTVGHGRMVLNDLGVVVQEEWLATEIVRPYVRLDSFVVMPDHTHAIVVFHGGLWVGGCCPVAGCGIRDGGDWGDPAGRPNDHDVVRGRGGKMPTPTVGGRTVGNLVGQFKSVATKRINRLRNTPGAPVWQRNYYERIIRDEREMNAIRTYIAENPARWSPPS